MCPVHMKLKHYFGTLTESVPRGFFHFIELSNCLAVMPECYESEELRESHFLLRVTA